MIVAIYIRRFSKWVISLLVTFLSHVIRVSKWLLANLPKLYGVITSTPMADITILFIGLPSSGKSSILYYIKLNEYVFTSSTGPIEEYAKFQLKRNKVVQLRLLENGKSESITHLREYLSKSPNVIFVIDSLDSYGLEEARRNVFDNLYEHLNIHKNPRYLILLSKQDIRGAVNVNEIEAFLKIPADIFDKCHISGCSALKGTGIMESIHWIITGKRGYSLNIDPHEYLIEC
ncbi:Probable ADP-ribosylation factor At2g15310 [Babesia microti strain RI]|uniref:Probable ADP-ribosylation factor At2g15310 n=1 Tax=Babesia microti (strain RI) TaxID=1133968 RepID=A0A1N6LX58_BABMR|nr:Probable ADP-ribosylation factor At2g15310 [Babesia microti strain RI]SIO73453.1 Probable ADP-ribosylation factor At2g15310 [Babesia microti strain RI]|eukprot:XP_021337550.1 Probable ADP-ribosylation factor At2g15310 [Babesia microti strain RI]